MLYSNIYKTKKYFLRLSCSFFSFSLKNYQTDHKNTGYVIKEGKSYDCGNFQYEAFEIKA